ncbi:hypothetical protein A2715_04680 [Candidatus Woesebacteria bacterium RIFCSPHIGHO2_01_FULL_39_32]|uniref:Uncharacterized protein n=1 Tax=Candidatus Woesebacteria bacterium RIFCSPLOWO2_01_FULL_39_25 TaxID=1802521 RepID=A0A1F8BL98_9BACT|nr:MAG: hypothetical protein A2124_03215 [Candidatus Woesebacteria bacterium GWB1_37_5]OGM25313.1 MAG: hypothetical protein A2715_04680 [Candidatus Woesebacteria bacterium RIFCSPHIGHO2_01_FULL_39_32]OGM37812.1 MAG: hypothetical protein A3F01_01890 [Candidatus Woesebacteria bacterium RIFCSPHIGHO2_12_FULL_38_11]OGM64844.1 MAG: hypothetical protein A2893_04290 [Candidatus Woesebacteria bacterium RIFCSPLOWO2_01_FULL_39_25]
MGIEDLSGIPDPAEVARNLDIPELRSEEHMADGDTVTDIVVKPMGEVNTVTVVIDKGVPTASSTDSKPTG